MELHHLHWTQKYPIILKTIIIALSQATVELNDHDGVNIYFYWFIMHTIKKRLPNVTGWVDIMKGFCSVWYPVWDRMCHGRDWEEWMYVAGSGMVHGHVDYPNWRLGNHWVANIRNTVGMSWWGHMSQKDTGETSMGQEGWVKVKNACWWHQGGMLECNKGWIMGGHAASYGILNDNDQPADKDGDPTTQTRMKYSPGDIAFNGRMSPPTGTILAGDDM